MKETMKKPVLVVGGGIGGIQASHDLAEMGVPVFLVESSPSIGGRMAQLDKTFPTNDCSACILAPKVTETYNHPLIKTLTWSEIEEIRGSAPNFTATIKRKARYIDEAKCKGCSDCTFKCPIEVKSEFDMGVGNRHAVYKPFAQAAPNIVAIDKRGSSPCKFTCPAHMDAHGFIALAGKGRFSEALEVIYRTTPFAGVLGRVCFHPCESKCTRGLKDEPLAIASIKRYIADRTKAEGFSPELGIAEAKPHKVAVIGAGPAGLNCAFKLAQNGYKVTVFERLPKPGGMLKAGIPDYRLDKEILEYEISVIEALGVEIRCGVELGKDISIDSLKKDGYSAIFVAVGAHSDMKIGIPGEDSDGVVASIDFLREINFGGKPEVGKNVLVIGGGNVAMDAARSAVRLGANVTIVYRRTRDEMPASEWEIHHAEEEGVNFAFLTTQTEILSENGKVKGLRCVKNRLGEPDASGRRAPVAIEGSDFIIPADTIIAAIGQRVDDKIKSAGVDCLTKRGVIEADKCQTPIEGVFAGGDARTGPSTAIDAVADGNRAAKAIINYLENKNESIEPFLLPETDISQVELDSLKRESRKSMLMLPPDERNKNFMEAELGFDEEQAMEEAGRCADCSICCECRACETACKAGAIFHEQQSETVELDVSAVIMCPGYDMTENIPAELGYNRFADVVTGLEYERILSASGPFGGHVQRPSDGRSPKRVAFIQCVGSRDHSCGADYCSSVCCMYAVKEAQVTKEHLPSVETIDIYFMDMRAFGKDFDRYIENGKNKYGINFIRSRVGAIDKDDDGTLILHSCNEDGTPSIANYDIVVLSTGFKANEKTTDLLKRTGIRTDRYGFISCEDMKAPATSKAGIYACGAASGPKDIPETVTEASAAAAAAAKEAFDVPKGEYERWFISEKPVPLRDVSKEPIRMGVFVCRCGVNIGAYVDVPAVCEYIRTLPFVVHVEDSLYTCSVDAQKNMMDLIEKHNLNRVVVASCTPRTHEPLFRAVLRKTGLNPYLFNMANIRDQCSWVHMDEPEAATEKAKQLVRMAVGKDLYAKELVRRNIPVEHSVLVIGGGAAGMSAALAIAEMGYKAILLEKSSKLGGNARSVNEEFSGRPIRRRIGQLAEKVLNEPLVEVKLGTEIKELDGYIGNFVTKLTDGTEVKHGAVIVATGAVERKPDEYQYGEDKRVITQTGLDKMLLEAPEKLKDIRNVVMIQCVGSREGERMYCSRVCCNQALRNSAAIKKLRPETDITILYRDMRSYGMHEQEYRDARKMGVGFMRYELERKPVVTSGDKLNVTLDGAKLEADLVVLASAIVPEVEENIKTAQMLKVPTTQDGFFLEAHAKLRPVDFATEGVYVCGLAHSPKNIRESMIQGRAAAGRAATVISKESLETEGTIASVDANLCTACGVCEGVCAYGAVEVKDVPVRGGTVRRAVVNDVLCKGCGTCAANCRCGAIDIGGFADRQIVSEIEYLLRK